MDYVTFFKNMKLLKLWSLVRAMQIITQKSNKFSQKLRKTKQNSKSFWPSRSNMVKLMYKIWQNPSNICTHPHKISSLTRNIQWRRKIGIGINKICNSRMTWLDIFFFIFLPSSSSTMKVFFSSPSWLLFLTMLPFHHRQHNFFTAPPRIKL